MPTVKQFTERKWNGFASNSPERRKILLSAGLHKNNAARTFAHLPYSVQGALMREYVKTTFDYNQAKVA